MDLCGTSGLLGKVALRRSICVCHAFADPAAEPNLQGGPAKACGLSAAPSFIAGFSMLSRCHRNDFDLPNDPRKHGTLNSTHSVLLERSNERIKVMSDEPSPLFLVVPVIDLPLVPETQTDLP